MNFYLKKFAVNKDSDIMWKSPKVGHAQIFDSGHFRPYHYTFKPQSLLKLIRTFVQIGFICIVLLRNIEFALKKLLKPG